MTQRVRFLVQLVIVAVTVAGYNSLVHVFGLPLPAFIVTAVVAGMFFCGWGCPFGAVQEWLRAIGWRMGLKNLNIPNPWHRWLSLIRYVLLVSVLVIAWEPTASPINARRTLLMYFVGRGLSVSAIAVLMTFVLLALFMDRPYCKYFCRFGAEYGLMGVLRIFTVRRDRALCIDCGACDRSCPMGLDVSTAGNLRTANCINCFRCFDACPVKGAISYGPALPRPAEFAEAARQYLSPKREKASKEAAESS